jgi:hypothetical protein
METCAGAPEKPLRVAEAKARSANPFKIRIVFLPNIA